MKRTSVKNGDTVWINGQPGTIVGCLVEFDAYDIRIGATEILTNRKRKDFEPARNCPVEVVHAAR